MDDKPFSEFKLKESRKAIQKIPQISSSLFQKYCHKYFYAANAASGQPIIHLMIALGVFGYALEYSHISKYFFLTLEHAKDSHH